MIVPASDQCKNNFCVALLNRELHGDSICPGNHSVSYNYGWFRIDDGKPFRRPDLTREADRLLESDTVYYSSVWNTYVLRG